MNLNEYYEVTTFCELSSLKLAGKSPQISRHRAPFVFVAALLTTALVGCGGGETDTVEPGAENPVVSVKPSLGAVFNADVALLCAPTGASLGTSSTGTSGEVSLPANASCAGPVLVTVSGKPDNTSTYYDEALTSTVPFPAGSSLRAILPALTGSASVAVTPLTEMAAAQALAAAGSLASLSAAQVQAANNAVVSQVFGADVSLNILTPPTLWTASTAAGSLGTSDADRYAFLLAGLAQMGSGAASPALAVTTALTADLADGTLSGSSSGTFIYSASSLATQLSAGLNALANYAAPELQSALGLTASLPVVVSGFSPVSGAVGSTVTLTGSGFDTDLFHMTVHFSNQVAAEIVSGTATTLVVKVPAGAVNGPVTVSRLQPSSSQTSADSFSVTSSGGGQTEGWTSRASPSPFLLNGLTYGNGLFVAVGFGNTVLTSADGVSWNTATPPDTDYYQGNAVLWDGSRYIMVGDSVYGSSQPALIATSTDGQSWTRRTWTSGSSESLVALAAANGRITTAGLNGSLLSSTDGGVTWVSESASGINSFEGLAAQGATRVAVGRNSNYQGVVLVNTGSGWTVAVPPADNFAPHDVIWAGDRFVAVGGDSVNYGAGAVVMTSIDGLSWTRVVPDAAAVPVGFKLVTALWTGTKLYASADDGNNRQVIASSSDGGTTWALEHQAQVSGNGVLAGLASSGTRIVAVGGVKSVTLP